MLPFNCEVIIFYYNTGNSSHNDKARDFLEFIKKNQKLSFTQVFRVFIQYLVEALLAAIPLPGLLG